MSLLSLNLLLPNLLLPSCFPSLVPPQMVVDSCATAALPAETASALLAPFDATRFAVLVCEQWDADSGEEEDGRGGGSSLDASHSRVSMQQLLALAHASLMQAGVDSVGLALLEGVLTMQPVSFLGAALQLALTCSSQQGRHDVLSMLGRVPTELLPTAVVADALTQVAEAVDGNHLAPPFLPYQLLGKLYQSQHVLRSMQLAVTSGAEAAAAQAAADAGASTAGQKLWTARVGGWLGANDGAGGGAADIAARGASGSSKLSPAAAERGVQAATGAVRESSNSLVLLPLQPSAEPLAAVLQRAIGAVLSCLLRRAGRALDAASLRCGCERAVHPFCVSCLHSCVSRHTVALAVWRNPGAVCMWLQRGAPAAVGGAADACCGSGALAAGVGLELPVSGGGQLWGGTIGRFRRVWLRLWMVRGLRKSSGNGTQLIDTNNP